MRGAERSAPLSRPGHPRKAVPIREVPLVGGTAMPEAIVLAIHADHADAILDGTARFEHRTLPPKRLPAKAYLAVVEARAVVGECGLGAPTRKSAQGWALPVTKPRRYR